MKTNTIIYMAVVALATAAASAAAPKFQAALPVFRRQKEGRIVQFTSLNGLFGIPFQSAYTASKHALEGWCQCLAQETARFGVRVTLVSPGDCRSGSDAYRGHAQASAAAEARSWRPARRRASPSSAAATGGALFSTAPGSWAAANS